MLAKLGRFTAIASTTAFLASSRKAPLSTNAVCQASPVTVAAPVVKPPHYTKLQNQLKEIEVLNGVRGLLGWDELVIMPGGASASRSDQNSILATLVHEMSTSEELKSTLRDVINWELPQLTDPYDRANVRDALRDLSISNGKTKEQTIAEAELGSQGYHAWVEARTANDFSKFQGLLSELLAIKKSIARSTRPHLSLYDANIDDYERGMNAKRLDEILLPAKEQIIPLLRSVLQSKTHKNYVAPPALLGSALWDVDKQAELCKEVAEKIGFDFDKGRFDKSVHPFTGGAHPQDVRITTRYSSDNWLEGVGGTVHEVGHALYEQGRNMDHNNQPVNRALSMGVHESQSLFWERMIFQSAEFWEWFTPVVHRYFPHTSTVTAKEFYEYVNRVSPGYIRVDADELTYPLHIVLRFEMEKGLFDGSIAVEDVPKVWNQKFKETIGLTVDKDSVGCLQDVHWSGGAFGYFPSYTLGSMIAAQLFVAAEKANPELRQQISRGEFKPIREWLRKNIHEVGSLYESPDELLTHVTGKPLDPNDYVKYLHKKYSTLYKN